MRTLLKACLFFCVVLSFSFKGQVSDTLVYVKSFETNKAEYINQPLSKLLNNMTQLQPKSIWSDETLIKTYNSMFKFNNMEDSFDVGTVNMVIFWQTPIPATETEYYENKNHFYFTNDERNFYGNKIVKDIYVYTTK